MTKKIAKILCMVLAMTMLLATGAMAATETPPGPDVRVNGVLVDFPDMQPFVDENDRTLVPVRFVTEAMGADVHWVQATKTAVIELNGIRVDIQIGRPDLTVTANGVSRKVVMDTIAVAQGGRTFVPIRYVAEALGAVVDYSDVYRTAGIYLSDTFTAEEIKMLRAYPYTQPEAAISYADYSAKYPIERAMHYYGPYREHFDIYENAHEYLYRAFSRNGWYGFESTEVIMENRTPHEFYNNMVAEAIAEVAYQSERLTVVYRADTSCIYQADTMDGITTCIRGIAVAKIQAKPADLTWQETALLCDLGYTKIAEGAVLSIPVDIHMSTEPDYEVSINTIVPLDNAY